MENDIMIIPLTQARFNEAVELVFNADLDTRDEIEHHLNHIDAHYVALAGNKLIGVIGWYQDNVQYATDAMNELFPGEDAYWVGFFAVDKNYRGKGTGKSLLQKLEDVVKEKNQTDLWVSSVPETKTYYENHGFVLVKRGAINGNEKYFMCKNLA